MDKLCQYVNSVINIDAEREKYTKMYDSVRNAVINGLKEDKHFKELFSGLKLCGSYADNLKISKPDEFDLVVCLKFPHNGHVKISADNRHRGNVLINISEVLDRLERDRKEDIRKFLAGMINPKKYLLEDKFQNWLQGCVDRFLKKINYQVTHADGSILFLHYRRQGPAHTIEVINSLHDFSIDFVPGFLFEASKSISERKVTSATWQAIPKPMDIKENTSFRTSYTESERTIFANKNQFKNILRMMKKFRDNKPKMVNLKSYHLKTLFLWHDERSPPDFWSKSTIELVHEMFSVLHSALEKHLIPFFWDKHHNLLARFSKTQIESMCHEVTAARRILMQSRENFASIFLTAEEQAEKEECENSETVVMDDLCQKISRVISNNCEISPFVKDRLEFVKNKLINNLKENKYFSQLYSEVKYCGIKADKLNVSKPNKFCLAMCLRLPHNDCVKINRDNERRGNVFINISEVLDRLEKEKKDDTLKFLEGMVNSKKYLLQDKFLNWVEGRFDNFLGKINKRLTYIDGSTLHLYYRKHGPAHIITVSEFPCEFSIHIEPGFLFEAKKSISKRKVTATHWQAIPRPICSVKDNKSFTPSYTESERKIFANKNQFKNILRMMKKFRDNKPSMVNLKSYHLNSLFLWHAEECSPGFWSSPTIEILHVMFKKLADALENKVIPSFWEKKLNLLAELKDNQISSMYIEVRSARHVLMHAENKYGFLRVFLNEEELSKVTQAEHKEESVKEEENVKEKDKEKEEEEEEEEEQQERREQLVQNQDTLGLMENQFAKLGLVVAASAAGYLIYKYATSRRNND